MSSKFLVMGVFLLGLLCFSGGLGALDIRNDNPLIMRMDSKKIITLAEAGDPQAQFDLAIMYGRGVGVQINHNLAWDWIEKA